MLWSVLLVCDPGHASESIGHTVRPHGGRYTRDNPSPHHISCLLRPKLRVPLEFLADTSSCYLLSYSYAIRGINLAQYSVLWDPPSIARGAYKPSQ